MGNQLSIPNDKDLDLFTTIAIIAYGGRAMFRGFEACGGRPMASLVEGPDPTKVVHCCGKVLDIAYDFCRWDPGQVFQVAGRARDMRGVIGDLRETTSHAGHRAEAVLAEAGFHLCDAMVSASSKPTYQVQQSIIASMKAIELKNYRCHQIALTALWTDLQNLPAIAKRTGFLSRTGAKLFGQPFNPDEFGALWPKQTV